MNLDAELYGAKAIPYDHVKRFFKETLPQIEFNKKDKKEVVLDVGCSPGGSTYNLVLPLFSQLEKLYAIDVLHNMIYNSERNNSHPLIEYSAADIVKW
ncbi:juvenile hormone acid O-methyltransferase [Caerostris darwini]|uniref:Juvenile hormone acid O-methyltransferase n=1 Tax=Caerostris darwini TaxID=1538125 RepID=A0AAV4Q2E7_9ARAC|nr:juvenile hormone acid O-methyltransferase [Caerostris darwini]